MEDIRTYLKKAVDCNYSDLFIIAGKEVFTQEEGDILPIGDEKLTPENADALIRELYRLADRSYDLLQSQKDDNFSLSIPGLARFRISAFRQRGSKAAAIRVVNFGIPDWKQMNIPDDVMKIAGMTRGLVLVTGPAGSGVSTTLACIVDAINRTRGVHILTIENPIEYLHRNQKGVVSQRELEVDTDSGLDALRSSLRQSPRVIVLEGMRDPDMIRSVLAAAETGRLVISTMYTMGAASTIERIIDSFPAFQQPQVRIQLGQVLQAVVSQQLLPAIGGGQVPAFEIMCVNHAVRNMIRESRTDQINTVLNTLAVEGIVSMDEFLFRMYKDGRIAADTALHFAVNADQLQKKMRIHTI